MKMASPDSLARRIGHRIVKAAKDRSQILSQLCTGLGRLASPLDAERVKVPAF
jgi:hypothetical protein